jgi:hypothetical protein
VKKVASTDIVALEVEPGKLLKLTTHTSPETLSEALTRADVVDTCGHLVSLAVHSKGVDNMPLALLTNHVKSALLNLYAADSSHSSPGNCQYVHHV